MNSWNPAETKVAKTGRSRRNDAAAPVVLDPARAMAAAASGSASCVDSSTSREGLPATRLDGGGGDTAAASACETGDAGGDASRARSSAASRTPPRPTGFASERPSESAARDPTSTSGNTTARDDANGPDADPTHPRRAPTTTPTAAIASSSSRRLLRRRRAIAERHPSVRAPGACTQWRQLRHRHPKRDCKTDELLLERGWKNVLIQQVRRRG